MESLDIADDDDQRLSALLRRCRSRISVECRLLGDFERLPARIGKRVTQEEVAEAVGITRHWYARMESDGNTRVSTPALSRIADTLMMDSAERASLFQLVLPEIRVKSPAQHASEVFDSVESLHRLTRRLWAASSKTEALSVARELAMTEFSADVMLTRARCGPGRWDLAGDGKSYDFERLKSAEAAIVKCWGDGAVDDLLCYESMIRPGEVLTMSERDAFFPDLKKKRRPALDVLGWNDVSSAMACIRSQSGFVARLSIVHTARHAYSKLERERLSALAELVSLALD